MEVVQGPLCHWSVFASYAKCCVHAGFSVAEAQRTVFVIFEAHETCIFF